MADVLVFGATGYTGTLTSRALAAREVDFVVAGRDRSKLETLAEATKASGVCVAEVGDADSLTRAAGEARVLLTCVGPFVSLGDTAVQAALRARVNYLDSSGEAAFIAGLIDRCDGPAKEAAIAMAPALGFDEVPADVAAALATEGLGAADLVLTYFVPTQVSWGTIRSALGALSSPSRWIEAGRPRKVAPGEVTRWAPMPPPLGPSPSVSAPFGEAYLATTHLNLRSLQLFVVAGGGTRAALRAWQVAAALPGLAGLLDRGLARFRGGPSEGQRAQSEWTILAEASDGKRGRNVVLSGRDQYGLTAELLATAAVEMASPAYDKTGVLAPSQAVPVERWRQELTRNGVSIDVIEH